MKSLLRTISTVSVLSLMLTLPARGGPDTPATPDAEPGLVAKVAKMCAGLPTDRDPRESVKPATTALDDAVCALAQALQSRPAPDDVNGAAPGDVRVGKTYWGLRTDGTGGIRTGTATGLTACDGVASPGGRWCDNGDGTVTDLTSGLVWLRDASWGGEKPWRKPSPDGRPRYDDAHRRAGVLQAGSEGAGLADGSFLDAWRLPTLSELKGLANGTEAVRSDTPRLFTGVQAGSYWTSTSSTGWPEVAFEVYLVSGVHVGCDKTVPRYVWPVRAGK